MKNVAVIGAGTMGNGIAHTFAQKGFKVSLIDISEKALEKGINTISTNLDRMIAREKITANDKQNTLDNITSFTDMKQGIAGVELVVEAATENVDLKLRRCDSGNQHFVNFNHSNWCRGQCTTACHRNALYESSTNHEIG